MTCSWQSTLNHSDIMDGMRKGGLQISNDFTINVFNSNINEETHPYRVNYFNRFDGEQPI